jgi:serine/threonine protein kinase
MGEVFLAYSPAGEPVAMKLIRADRLDLQTRARFEQEALTARTIVGTSRVAHFLDADPFADRPWLAMEYIAGPTLDRFVNGAGALPALLVASLGALSAEGLAAVHAVGLLHRDLKPGNVILGENGPVIIDFGLATFVDVSSSLSHPGMQIGTPVCMPPEQANGQTRVTAAADVYGLGTVLLYAAAGHYPYGGVNRDVVLARVASPDVAPDLSGLPGELEPLISGMLAYEEQARPTLEQVAEACVALVTGSGRTMAQARRMLLAHLEQHPQSERPSEVPFEVWSSLEARIDAEAAEMDALQALDIEALSSPLNGSPGAYTRLLREAAERISPDGGQQPVEPADPTNPQPVYAGSGSQHVEPKRMPTAQRIAEELRAAYAVGRTL